MFVVNCDVGGRRRGPTILPPPPSSSLARVTRWVLADAAAACCCCDRTNLPACISSLHWGPFPSQNRTPEARSSSGIPSPHHSLDDDTLDDGLLLHSPDSEELRPRAVGHKGPLWASYVDGLVPNWPSLSLKSDSGRRLPSTGPVLMSKSTVERRDKRTDGCGRQWMPSWGCIKRTPWIHRQESSNTTPEWRHSALLAITTDGTRVKSTASYRATQ